MGVLSILSTAVRKRFRSKNRSSHSEMKRALNSIEKAKKKGETGVAIPRLPKTVAEQLKASNYKVFEDWRDGQHGQPAEYLSLIYWDHWGRGPDKYWEWSGSKG